MPLPQLVLLLSALPFAGVGIAFLIAPTPMAELVGISLSNPTAIADTRAVYGGLQIACGGFLAYAAGRRSWHRPALAMQLATFAGLFFARLLSYTLSGLPSSLGYLLHAGEALGLVFGIAAWRKLDRDDVSADQHRASRL